MKKYLNKNRKGFTLIELIVVMAIIGILVLLAAPRYLNYTNEAKLTQIKNDVKAVEGVVTAYMATHEQEMPKNGTVADKSDLEKAVEDGMLYNTKGKIVDNNDIKGSYFEVLDKAEVVKETKTKLGGDFVVNSDGMVYYIHDKTIKTEDPKNQDKEDDDECLVSTGEMKPINIPLNQPVFVPEPLRGYVGGHEYITAGMLIPMAEGMARMYGRDSEFEFAAYEKNGIEYFVMFETAANFEKIVVAEYDYVLGVIFEQWLLYPESDDDFYLYISGEYGTDIYGTPNLVPNYKQQYDVDGKLVGCPVLANGDNGDNGDNEDDSCPVLAGEMKPIDIPLNQPVFVPEPLRDSIGGYEYVTAGMLMPMAEDMASMYGRDSEFEFAAYKKDGKEYFVMIENAANFEKIVIAEYDYVLGVIFEEDGLFPESDNDFYLYVRTESGIYIDGSSAMIPNYKQIYDEDGTLMGCPELKNLFHRHYGGGSEDFLSSIEQTPDGGYIAVGNTKSKFGDMDGVGYPNPLLINSIMIKTNKLGSVEWVRSFGGSDADYFTSVINTSDGGYLAVGHSKSDDYLMEGIHRGDNDAIMVKVDSYGNLEWFKNFGGGGSDIFNDVVELPNNNFIAVGYSNSTDGHMTGKNNGVNDAIMVSVQANGSLIQLRSFGGSNSDIFNSIVRTGNGELYIAGNSSSNDSYFYNKNKGNVDATVFKFDNTGGYLWVKTYGGTDSDTFNEIKTTADGGFVAVGRSKSSDGDMLDTHLGFPFDDHDAIIVKADVDGNIEWNKNYGGHENDVFNSVVQTSDGDYVFTGNSRSNSPTSDFGYLNGSSDLILLKTDSLGNKIWTQTHGFKWTDSGESIIINLDNGYTVVGFSEGRNGDINPKSKGNFDGIILKLNQNGKLY